MKIRILKSLREEERKRGKKYDVRISYRTKDILALDKRDIDEVSLAKIKEEAERINKTYGRKMVFIEEYNNHFYLGVLAPIVKVNGLRYDLRV